MDIIFYTRLSYRSNFQLQNGYIRLFFVLLEYYPLWCSYTSVLLEIVYRLERRSHGAPDRHFCYDSQVSGRDGAVWFCALAVFIIKFYSDFCEAIEWFLFLTNLVRTNSLRRIILEGIGNDVFLCTISDLKSGQQFDRLKWIEFNSKKMIWVHQPLF